MSTLSEAYINYTSSNSEACTDPNYKPDMERIKVIFNNYSKKSSQPIIEVFVGGNHISLEKLEFADRIYEDLLCYLGINYSFMEFIKNLDKGFMYGFVKNEINLYLLSDKDKPVLTVQYTEYTDREFIESLFESVFDCYK